MHEMEKQQKHQKHTVDRNLSPDDIDKDFSPDHLEQGFTRQRRFSYLNKQNDKHIIKLTVTGGSWKEGIEQWHQ